MEAFLWPFDPQLSQKMPYLIYSPGAKISARNFCPFRKKNNLCQARLTHAHFAVGGDGEALSEPHNILSSGLTTGRALL